MQVDIEAYYKGILSRDRAVLAKAITLVESTLDKDEDQAARLLTLCIPYSGNSIRVGVTGVPGVGKSTFINALGSQLVRQGHKVAVLAVDPTSERSGGSILGDKTRMNELASEPNAFVRPSPSSGTLGGVARKTKEAIILCEAAGFDVIFVETVGVGQSETAVSKMVDFFLLLVLAGAGDELQGIKRGIMELADTIAINKADGDNLVKAKKVVADYKNALHLFPPNENGWMPKVKVCSSITGEGLEKVWESVEEFKNKTTQNGYFTKRRKEQEQYWMLQTIENSLKLKFFSRPQVAQELETVKAAIASGEISSFEGAKRVLALI